MADRFEDLGIAPELATGAEAMGWDVPGGLQKDAVPVIRRGNNVVLHASAGSGVVGAYGLGLLDRLAQGDDEATPSSPRILVLVADIDRASRTADSLARLAAPAGLSARAQDTGWADRPVDLLALTPTAAAAAVRDSALKLDGVIALVIDGLDHIEATGQSADLETMVDIAPAAAQRVLVTGRLDAATHSFVERHIRRAMNIPSRTRDEEEVPGGGIPVRYRVATEADKAGVVAALLSELEAVEVAVVCRSQDRAERLEAALSARGVMDAAEGGAPRVRVLPFPEADRRSTQADVISADVPFHADTLTLLHGKGGIVLVTPREREHLVRIARRAGLALKPVPDPAPVSRSPAEEVRDRIRALLGDPASTDPAAARASSDADQRLAADLALVAPLLDEYPAAEVAAAALYLARAGFRDRDPTDRSQASAPGGPEGPAVGKRPGAGAPPPSSATTWTHLFMTIGSRDDATPGDVVGAMTGEAGIGGEQVGKIDIRESHTTVEVATGVADQVITALNGRTLKGRSLRVDYDRKTRAPSKGGGKGPGGRGPSGRGPSGKGSSGKSSGGRPPRRG